jgi:hypothetical protein
MEWMCQKSLRNQKLKEFERRYLYRTGCIVCRPPSYPVRPASKHQFESIGGFHQHPNVTQEL